MSGDAFCTSITSLMATSVSSSQTSLAKTPSKLIDNTGTQPIANDTNNAQGGSGTKLAVTSSEKYKGKARDPRTQTKAGFFARGLNFNPCLGGNLRQWCFIIAAFLMLFGSAHVIDLAVMPSSETCRLALTAACRYYTNTVNKTQQQLFRESLCFRNKRQYCGIISSTYISTAVLILILGIVSGAFLLAALLAKFHKGALVSTVGMGSILPTMWTLAYCRYAMTAAVTIRKEDPDGEGYAPFHYIQPTVVTPALIYSGIAAIAMHMELTHPTAERYENQVYPYEYGEISSSSEESVLQPGKSESSGTSSDRAKK